jgi:predicted metal-dependent RNase
LVFYKKIRKRAVEGGYGGRNGGKGRRERKENEGRNQINEILSEGGFARGDPASYED